MICCRHFSYTGLSSSLHTHLAFWIVLVSQAAQFLWPKSEELLCRRQQVYNGHYVNSVYDTKDLTHTVTNRCPVVLTTNTLPEGRFPTDNTVLEGAYVTELLQQLVAQMSEPSRLFLTNYGVSHIWGVTCYGDISHFTPTNTTTCPWINGKAHAFISAHL